MFLEKKIKWLFVCSGLFLIMGLLVFFGVTDGFDEAIQQIVFSMRGEGLTLFLKGITYSANWQAVAILCALLLLIKKTRLAVGVPLSLSAGFSAFFYHYAKVLIARPRPDLNLHLIAQGGFSFPSGHAMTGLVFYGLILFFLLKNQPKNGAKKALFFGFLSWIFLIGFSRVYLGVHYPTDVLAGWFAGAGILTMALLIIEKVYPSTTGKGSSH